MINGYFQPKKKTSYMNEKFWKKSYMLEFQNNNYVQDAFTLSVAPENEDFTFPQRVNETKTFGGSVIDDYGNDMVKISLSGSTINQEIKRIYRGGNELSDKFLNGEQEIFYLKELFQKYGKAENLQGKAVYLYALDSANKAKWWKVYLQDFSIKRSKDSPLRYNYTITMIADPETILPIDTKNSSQLSFVVTEVNENLEKIQNSVDFLNSYRNYITGLTTALSNVKSTLTNFSAAVELYEDVALGYIDDLTSAVDETTSIGSSVYKTAIRLTFGVANNLYSAAQKLLSAVVSMKSIILNNDYTALINSYLASENITTQRIVDVFNTTVLDAETAADKAYMQTIKMLNTNEVLVIPGTDGADDSTIKVYGFVQTVMKDSDTWDSLALAYYGDADYGSVVAAYNNKDGTVSFSAGSEIKIPIIQEHDKPELENEIYSVLDSKDNYGKDIKINDSGELAIYNGDLAVTKSISTLTQAIGNRLKTASNSRIRTEFYGIKSTVGSASDASNVFLISSIQQTVQADPRVQSVDSIEYTGNGDKLEVSVGYTDINNIKQSFGGEI